MCIAIYSMRGNDIPKESYLKNSFEYNPDGAGFAFNTNDGKVQVVKGLMTWENFISTFRKYEKKYGFKDRGVLIHFRITTSGGTNKPCCHPFPISDNEDELHQLEYKTDYACIHNGIISLTSSEASKRKLMSDTMVFIEKYLTKIASNNKWFYNEENFKLLYELLDSKMAILNGKGEIKSTEGFEQDSDGNYYSNSSYLYSNYFSYKNTRWDSFDDYYFGDAYGYDEDYIELMKLPKDCVLSLNNFEESYYDDKEEIDYFISKNGECFIGEKTDTEYIIETEIDYIDEGVMLDKNYNSVKFKPTNYLILHYQY